VRSIPLINVSAHNSRNGLRDGWHGVRRTIKERLRRGSPDGGPVTFAVGRWNFAGTRSRQGEGGCRGLGRGFSLLAVGPLNWFPAVRGRPNEGRERSPGPRMGAGLLALLGQTFFFFFFLTWRAGCSAARLRFFRRC